VPAAEEARASGWIAGVKAAAEWRLVSLLLERPRAGWAEEVRSLAGEIADPELRRAAECAASAASEGEYHRILGPGGCVSPREVSYTRADPGAVLADLSRAYAAFAYRPRAEEPIDHIAVETGFAGYLYLKEAFARSSGDSEAAGRVASARRAFFENHLQGFAAGFAQRLEALSPSYLCECSRALAQRCALASASRFKTSG
jgi:nitrate reductase assembly molybdenum cofactor insertion protein NarJ